MVYINQLEDDPYVASLVSYEFSTAGPTSVLKPIVLLDRDYGWPSILRIKYLYCSIIIYTAV